MLIGNKIDLQGQRKVSSEQAQAFAVKNGMLYQEVSAKDGSYISEALAKLEKVLIDGKIEEKGSKEEVKEDAKP